MESTEVEVTSGELGLGFWGRVVLLQGLEGWSCRLPTCSRGGHQGRTVSGGGVVAASCRVGALWLASLAREAGTGDNSSTVASPKPSR